jgi:hypothetical protein
MNSTVKFSSKMYIKDLPEDNKPPEAYSETSFKIRQYSTHKTGGITIKDRFEIY